MADARIEIYEKRIREERNYLTLISYIHSEILKVAKDKKTARALEKQNKLFYNLVSVKGDFKKYNKKTKSNLKKVDTDIGISEISKLEDRLKGNRSFNQNEIDEVLRQLHHHDTLKSALDFLLSEYRTTLWKIKDYESTIEEIKKDRQKQFLEEAHEAYTPSSTYSTDAEEIKTISEPGITVIPPAKKAGLVDKLKGKDVNADKIVLLYGLAADLLIFMDADQKVQVKDVKSKDTFESVTIYSSKEERDAALKTLLQKYNANSLESLLDTYDRLRNTYFKEYSKLSDDQKEKYKLSNCSNNDIPVLSSQFKHIDSRLLDALKNDGLQFPPSKQELINMMNQRILNGQLYATPEAKVSEYVTSEANNLEQYMAVYKYYRNLTKNMTVEETVQLYQNIIKEKKPDRIEFKSEAHKTYYYSNLAIIQKLFGELIMEKKNIDFIDSKQQRQVVAEIIKKEMKEDLRIYVPQNEELKPEEKIERHQTIHAEYLKYLASQKVKKAAMSFSEFIQKRYALDKDEQTVIIEETKGIRI